MSSPIVISDDESFVLEKETTKSPRAASSAGLGTEFVRENEKD